MREGGLFTLRVHLGWNRLAEHDLHDAVVLVVVRTDGHRNTRQIRVPLRPLIHLMSEHGYLLPDTTVGDVILESATNLLLDFDRGCNHSTAMRDPVPDSPAIELDGFDICRVFQKDLKVIAGAGISRQVRCDPYSKPPPAAAHVEIPGFAAIGSLNDDRPISMFGLKVRKAEELIECTKPIRGGESSR